MVPTFGGRSALEPLSKMNDPPRFKFVCDVCGSMTIKVAQAGRLPEATIVECGRCSSPGGITLAAFRELARTGDLFEF